MIQVIRYMALTLPLIAFSSLSFAVNVYECEDAKGNRTFQDHCPPGSHPVNEKNYSTGTAQAAASSSVNATLYSIPDCEACDEIREFLKLRNISITDKNVSSNLELQGELKTITGGDLKVPAVVIGEKTIIGYKRSELLDALKAAGYVEPESSSKPEASPNAETENNPAK